MVSIALDGPSGSGKSTVSKIIARKLGFMSVDTGALYRSVAYFMQKDNIDFMNESEVSSYLKNMNLKIRNNDGKQQILFGDHVLDKELRTPSVTEISSIIAKYSCVRNFLLEIQREFAKDYNIVIDGRDIGTVVLPNADVKIFLTASPEVRAKRRLNQMVSNGIKAEYSEILEAINKRDYEDEHRKIAPLKMATDAILVDNSDYDLKQTVDKILTIIKEKIG